MAEQRQGRGVFAKVFEQNCKGLGYLAVWPIVADPVAQAIGPGNALLALIAVVVTFPVSGMLKHHLLDDCPQMRDAADCSNSEVIFDVLDNVLH